MESAGNAAKHLNMHMKASNMCNTALTVIWLTCLPARIAAQRMVQITMAAVR
jgi:hypothetical protein